MSKTPKKINLALQGGGAHGAFTWGVLDRLLEESDLEIEGISGTSAGAMNAVVLAEGMTDGGRLAAKTALQSFWWEISLLGNVFNPIKKTMAEKMEDPWNLDWSLSYTYHELMSRILSPYQSNPLNINPLKWVLEKKINFKKLCDSPIKLFIAATSVTTGRPRIFKHDEVTLDSLLASACIPFLFQAIKIDDDYYWDGGYMGNPVLWPLVYRCSSQDILLIQINPLIRKEIPYTSNDIINRLNEITFNSSLISEMRAINFVSKLIEKGKLSPDEYKDIKMHIIKQDSIQSELNASSKLNTNWDFFQHLKKAGYTTTEIWLRENKKLISEKSSIDIFETFLK